MAPNPEPAETFSTIRGGHLRALARFPQARGKGCCESAPAATGGLLEICALLVPKEMKLEHSAGVKSLTDEQLEQAIAALKEMIAAQAGECANVIGARAEPAALPAPDAQFIAAPEPKSQREPNRLMMEADTAIGPQERKPRKVPSPAST
jgi:hypothetical protein